MLSIIFKVIPDSDQFDSMFSRKARRLTQDFPGQRPVICLSFYVFFYRYPTIKLFFIFLYFHFHFFHFISLLHSINSKYSFIVWVITKVVPMTQRRPGQYTHLDLDSMLFQAALSSTQCSSGRALM